MKRVDTEDIDSLMGPATVKKRLTSELGAENLAINYYELMRGDSFAFGYHTHSDQEEVFYIISGTVTFETEEGELEVSGGEAVRFAPGEYQRGINKGNEPVVALALGSPQDSGELDLMRECENCGERTENEIEMAETGDELVTRCLECGEVTGRFD